MRGLTLLLLLSMTTVVAAERPGDDGPVMGSLAPDFTLPMATRDTIDFSGVHLAEIIGKKLIVLAFYPADWSGGCTKEMCSFRDSFGDLQGRNAMVFGISGDYVFSHRQWAKDQNLPFTLLSDHDHAVAKRYGSYNPDSGFNRRTVFVIDRKGAIAYKDMSYKPGMTDSFEKLRVALSSIH